MNKPHGMLEDHEIIPAHHDPTVTEPEPRPAYPSGAELAAIIDALLGLGVNPSE